MIKTTAATVCILLFAAGCGKGSSDKKPGEKFKQTRLYVLGSSLSLRKKPSLKAKRITVIKYGAYVKPAAQQTYGELFTAGGVRGRWLKVKLNNRTGYAFSGFLSKMPAPQGVSTPEAYVKKYLKKRGKPVVTTKDNITTVKQPYTKGAALITTVMQVSGTEYKSYQLLLTAVTRVEAFLLGRALFAQGAGGLSAKQASFSKSHNGSHWEIQRDNRNVKIVPVSEGFIIAVGEIAD